jgi:hypothetical protein
MHQEAGPVHRDPAQFDRSSGSLVERLIFNHRTWVMLACLLVTAVFGYQLRLLHVNASFEKMLPHSHEFVRHYLEKPMTRFFCRRLSTVPG